MKKITIAIIGNIHHDLMKHSIESTSNAVDECEDILIFSDKNFVDYGTFVPIKSKLTIEEYSTFCLKSLSMFVKTEFVLIIQYDGMAVNRQFWDDRYFNCDYIGAPWDNKRFNWILDNEIVGNGGFSLRSAALLEALLDPEIRQYENNRFKNEDAIICQGFSSYLKNKYKIKFASSKLANSFSHEWCNPTGNTFGFHGVWNVPLYFDENILLKYIKEIPKSQWYKDRYDMFVQNCKKTNKHKFIDMLNEKLKN